MNLANSKMGFKFVRIVIFQYFIVLNITCTDMCVMHSFIANYCKVSIAGVSLTCPSLSPLPITSAYETET